MSSERQCLRDMSGVPLVIREDLSGSFVQTGIGSIGPRPCESNNGVFVDVLFYKDWIIQNLQPNYEEP